MHIFKRIYLVRRLVYLMTNYLESINMHHSKLLFRISIKHRATPLPRNHTSHQKKKFLLSPLKSILKSCRVGTHSTDYLICCLSRLTSTPPTTQTKMQNFVIISLYFFMSCIAFIIVCCKYRKNKKYFIAKTTTEQFESQFPCAALAIFLYSKSIRFL